MQLRENRVSSELPGGHQKWLLLGTYLCITIIVDKYNHSFTALGKLGSVLVESMLRVVEY